jgi:hypothetical protein
VAPRWCQRTGTLTKFVCQFAQTRSPAVTNFSYISVFSSSHFILGADRLRCVMPPSGDATNVPGFSLTSVREESASSTLAHSEYHADAYDSSVMLVIRDRTHVGRLSADNGCRRHRCSITGFCFAQSRAASFSVRQSDYPQRATDCPVVH